MTKSDRAALRELLARGTQGKWEVDGDGREICEFPYSGLAITETDGFVRGAAVDDAAFIVAARNSLAGLLDALDVADFVADAVREYCDGDGSEAMMRRLVKEYDAKVKR